MPAPDILIVGAGIVGAACAEACARAGLRVLVVDRGPVGGGTTSAGMGHLVVMDDSEAQFALTAYSRELWRHLAAELPDEVEYDPCGTLWVAADADEMAEVRRKHAFYQQRGVLTEILEANALLATEPNLRRGLIGGLRVVDDAVLYPPAAARWLLDRARARRTEVRTGVTVTAVTADGVVLADGSRLTAGRVVNATGCWSPALSPGLPVRKRKGHLVITDRYPGLVRHQMVELGYLKSAHAVATDSVAFNLQPRKTGQMLLGSSRQFAADDTGVDEPLLRRMLRRAAEYVPTLGQLSAWRVWTGHRAATPDKLPFIGPTLESDRIWLATGHEGLGITTSLGTGALLADLVTGRTPAIAPEPFLPSEARLRPKPVPGLTDRSWSVQVSAPAPRSSESRRSSEGRGQSEARLDRPEFEVSRILADSPAGRGRGGPVPETVMLRINGDPVRVARGTVVAAALAQAGIEGFRRSVNGEPRAPLCGMGLCFECRVTINGRLHCRSCQTLCAEGMEVQTDAER